MTAYVGSTTGSWLTDTNWTPVGVPGNGDTFNINNGVIVTADAGSTFVIGASPDDDAATPAMASTGTGSVGKNPVSQPNGELIIPQLMKIISTRKVTSLFSKKKRMILFNIYDVFI